MRRMQSWALRRPDGRLHSSAKWGGFLGIELEDFGYAIRKGETEWVARFLQRFPALRGANDNSGQSFRTLAQQSGNPEIARLFESVC